MDEQLQFPLGKFKWIDEPSSDQINTGMETLANFSQQLKNNLAGSNEEAMKKILSNVIALGAGIFRK